MIQKEMIQSKLEEFSFPAGAKLIAIGPLLGSEKSPNGSLSLPPPQRQQRKAHN